MPLPLVRLALKFCGLSLWAPGIASAPVAAGEPAAPPLRVLWFHADQAGDSVAINGFVRRVSARPGTVPGYIRVAAPRADGGGDAIACLRSRDLQRAGSRGGTFRVRLAGAGAPGRVAVTYAPTCP
ncbi:hypothetical protein [Novosphingobium sp.]|uniref:hypothetical protein n=1 Tax=Novosphingobium sp. TaxID=1874826 RepID=UPI0026209BE6|nr:hypothetical protein [Novosphingobium sp.]